MHTNNSNKTKTRLHISNCGNVWIEKKPGFWLPEYNLADINNKIIKLFITFYSIRKPTVTSLKLNIKRDISILKINMTGFTQKNGKQIRLINLKIKSLIWRKQYCLVWFFSTMKNVIKYND